ncbi:Bug family tripartite tricarboxylate transporter substrate binding protein [Roseomonas haemaphysalidis]|uniref:Tripartite tricarboxylate transporter substrate binding protein n=1 Tax=Roseomonas haemaphysalidis TaxID=2768162 RepID=A0ABS3KLV7_9PROT|nr:tripartite tricarboxylate transporter substrate binding protein [Roseomonas haemaphysalidis]MBO1078002.1 tripartite tricarboxylate transporter substrate binding protein [Roseomonas haemaphysalidis]
MQRRTALALLSAALLPAAAGARAQGAWRPSKPVTLLVPFPPGGATDLCARALQPGLQAALGQNVIVENRPGATGVLGTRAVAAMPGDGHVMLVNASGTMTIQPVVMQQPGFDPVRDFKPVVLAMSAPNVIVVHPSVPARDVAELKAWMAAQGDRLSFSSSGIGSSEQLGMELFLLRTGLKAVHVPYAGGAAAITAVMQNTVPLSMVNSGTAAPQIASGQLRMVAVAGARRLSWAPEVATMAEQGLPDLLSLSWTGVFVPAATPDPVADALHAALATTLRQPEVVERFERIRFVVEGGSRAELETLVAGDLARWRGVVRDAGIAVN